MSTIHWVYTTFQGRPAQVGTIIAIPTLWRRKVKHQRIKNFPKITKVLSFSKTVTQPQIVSLQSPCPKPQLHQLLIRCGMIIVRIK